MGSLFAIPRTPSVPKSFCDTGHFRDDDLEDQPGTSVLSPKYEVFCRRSVGCFSRRERSAHIFVIRVERATRKNSQLAPAQRVAMKIGRRLRCSSVTYRIRYAPSSRLAGGPF